MTEPSGAVARRSVLCLSLVTVGFVFLTAVMTWPQMLVLRTHAADHHDVFFNLWRIRWIAHALSTSPADLFDANIFYPDPGVLAYSDAMLVQGVLGAPLLWAGVPPVLVHNLLLRGAMVASAVGIFVLARHITGSIGGGVIAGTIFAFAPYRFEHYMHMELQWTVWSPWAFWALQRTLETGSPRFGLAMGGLLALQMTSSVYYGLFLLLLIAVVGALQLLTVPRQRLAPAAGALALAGVVAMSISWAYSIPYRAASTHVGVRAIHEVRTYSAQPRDYLVATPTNHLYGSSEGAPERRLFPGLLPLILALVGLVLLESSTTAVAYLVGLVVAFELSLGANGYVYPVLYEHVEVLRGLRVPARASAFVLLFLGILAARGTAVLTAGAPQSMARLVPALACVVILLEYRVGPLRLVEYHNEAPALYKVLARLPPGVLFEFPVPAPDSLPYLEPRFVYMSTFHWKPLLNGYSGFYPRSYLRRLDRASTFPDEESVASLGREGVRYIVVHDDAGERVDIVERLTRLGVRPLANLHDGWSVATLLEVK